LNCNNLKSIFYDIVVIISKNSVFGVEHEAERENKYEILSTNPTIWIPGCAGRAGQVEWPKKRFFADFPLFLSENMLKYPHVYQQVNASRPSAEDIAQNRTNLGKIAQVKLACPVRVPYTLMGSIINKKGFPSWLTTPKI